MASPDNQLVPLHSGAPGRLRSTWLQYQNAKPIWHIVVPTGLSVFAGIAITWAWTMLDQQEYGVAMLLVLFFLVVGIGAALSILNRTFRIIALVIVVVITGFSGLKIWFEKGDKRWTTLFSRKETTAQAIPQPSASLTPANVLPVLSPWPSASASMPTPTVSPSPVATTIATATATPTATGTPSPSPLPTAEASPSMYDQFVNYPSALKTPIRKYPYLPASEELIRYEVRLVFEDGFPIRYKQIIVYIPPTRRWVVWDVIKIAIAQARTWAEEIENSQKGNPEFSVANGFSLRSSVIIFNAAPIWSERLKILSQQGHKVKGPVSEAEIP